MCVCVCVRACVWQSGTSGREQTVLKGIHHRKVFMVCLQIDPESYDFVSEISWPEMKFIAES